MEECIEPVVDGVKVEMPVDSLVADKQAYAQAACEYGDITLKLKVMREQLPLFEQKAKALEEKLLELAKKLGM